MYQMLQWSPVDYIFCAFICLEKESPYQIRWCILAIWSMFVSLAEELKELYYHLWDYDLSIWESSFSFLDKNCAQVEYFPFLLLLLPEDYM